MTRETEMTAGSLFNRAVQHGWISGGKHGDLEVHQRIVPAAAWNAIVMEKRNRADGQHGDRFRSAGVLETESDDVEPKALTTPRGQLVEILDRLAERARIAETSPPRIEQQDCT